MNEGSSQIEMSEVLQLTGEHRFLYVWGRIKYTDGFDQERFTAFCHRYNWRRRKEANGRFRIARKYGRYHVRGNDAE